MKPIPAGKRPAEPPKKANKTVTKPAGRKTPAGKAAPARAKKPAAKTKADALDRALTEKEREFVDQYLVDLNATQAAIRAKYSPKTARQQASRLLSNVYIQQAIAEARKHQQERTQIEADRVVTEAWNIATADARELVEVKVGCCRYCYGEGHKWHRTVAEMNYDVEQWVAAGNDIEGFDHQGGIGYTPLKGPHPTCPECFGDGQGRVVLKDTRTLSPAALALYAGAKHGKHGIEVQVHDKAAAMEKLFKHMGLYEKDNDQKTDPLKALLMRVASTSSNGFMPIADDPERPTQQGSSIPVNPNPFPEDDEDD